MKICLISKYPPIEGGISSNTYWLAKSLGEKGHKVHIVTNALEVENEYREELDLNDPNYCPNNVFIHSTSPSPTIEANPSHIPFSNIYCEKLASLAIQTIEEFDIDIIDSYYLVPYCVSGFLAKSFTNTPQIIRHGGSDIQRLYPSLYLNNLLDKIIKSADTIITNDTTINFFQNKGISPSKITIMQKMPVNTLAFNPKVLPLNLSPYITNQIYYPDIPVISYIGKITHHFETKGLYEFLTACADIQENFLLLFVVNGKKLNQFKQLIKNFNLDNKTLFLNFVPPWQIPSILKSCTCIIELEKENSPIYDYHISSIASESLMTGRCTLISNALYKKQPYCNLKNKQNIFIVNPNNITKIKEILLKIIKNPNISNNIGNKGYEAIIKYENFNKYIDKTIEIYKSVLFESTL